MLTQLSCFIKSKIDISDHEIEQILPFISLKKYKKNEIIIKEGEYFDFIGFLNLGLIRSYFQMDGKEITARFTFENCMFTYLESLFDNKLSHKNYQALEYCEALILKKDDISKILAINPKFESLFKILLYDESIIKLQSLEAERTETPTNRYLTFLKENPNSHNRLPIKYIASYLGIEPQSLSRIRGRLASDLRK